MKVLIALLAFAASLQAEEPYRVVSDAGKIPPTMAKADFKRGQLDKDGKLVFLTLHHPTVGTRNLSMKGDYGAMIYFNEASGEDRYEFFSAAAKKIVTGDTLDGFLKLVRSIPRGKRLDLYNFCLSGSHYRYPKEHWERITATCKEAGVSFDRGRDGFSICICEGAKD